MKKILPIVLLGLLLLSGCAESAPCQTEFFAMDTLMELKVWGDATALEAAREEILRLEALCSATDAGSALSHLNQEGYAALSPELCALTEDALRLSDKTCGIFDPTVYPLVCAWGFPDDSFRVPQKQELSALLSYVGTQHVHVTDAEVVLDEGTALDFGGIAKGYAAQRCTEVLREMGVTTALLALGGNVQTLGTKPDGNPWVIGIADPAAPSQAIATLSFTGSRALVTSGSYQRCFVQDGQRYHHILDPKTGRPAESGLASVTVLCDNGTVADVYSTALFVMGLEDGAEFWRQWRDFEAVFITEDGSIYATSGCAQWLSGCEFTEIRP